MSSVVQPLEASLSRLYWGYPTNLPFLSLKELQVLYHYSEHLVKREAQRDLLLLIGHPTSPSHSPSRSTGHNLSHLHETRLDLLSRWDDQITRALCDDLEDKKVRWEKLHEQWKVARRAAGTDIDNTEVQVPYSLNLDPHHRYMPLAMMEHQRNQEAAMNALLDIQAQQNRDASANQAQTMLSEDPSSKTQQKQSTVCTDGKPLTNGQHSITPGTVPSPSSAIGTNAHPSIPTSGEGTALTKSLQGLKQNTISEQVVGENEEFRVIRPSVSYLPETTDGRAYPRIHFPALSYIIHHDEDGATPQSRDTALTADQLYHPRHNCK